MVIYSIIMLLTGGLMAGLSAAIHRGKTDLIHSYHQAKVADKAAYGKAFGKAMWVVSGTLLLSGIIGLLGDNDAIAMIAVAVLLVGLAAGIACIAAVQKKYNSGIF